MIKNIDIANFQTFDSLKIEAFKQINLIGGKNNAGKTSLLEALQICIAKGDNIILKSILVNRGLWKSGYNDTYKKLVNNKLKNGIIGFTINQFALYLKNENAEYEAKFNGHDVYLNPSSTAELDLTYFSYVSSKPSMQAVADLWDSIVLTQKEKDVLQIVKDVIDSRIERIHISEKSILVGIDDTKVNIKTLGEGVSKILFIALYMAEAKGKYLLIDEIETGLHYSVLEKLWNVIFKYAKEWDIQVFATTHSQDAIRTFKYASSENTHAKADAQYLRLQKNREGKYEAITFDNDRLHTSLDLDLEIR